MDEPVPIEVVHVTFRTGSNESRRDHSAAVEPTLLIDRFAVDKAPGALTFTPSHLLHDEPLREAPRTDPRWPFAWVARVGRRRVEFWCHDARHRLELAGEPRLQDLRKVARLRPSIE